MLPLPFHVYILASILYLTIAVTHFPCLQSLWMWSWGRGPEFPYILPSTLFLVDPNFSAVIGVHISQAQFCVIIVLL